MERGLRIPRTRGDGPVQDLCRQCDIPDSPHPRGWTQAMSAFADDVAGFPAPAGMDPLDSVIPGDQQRIPRTRGDGP